MQIKGDDEYPHIEGTRNGLRYEVHYCPKASLIRGIRLIGPIPMLSAKRAQRWTSLCTSHKRSTIATHGGPRCIVTAKRDRLRREWRCRARIWQKEAPGEDSGASSSRVCRDSSGAGNRILVMGGRPGAGRRGYLHGSLSPCPCAGRRGRERRAAFRGCLRLREPFAHHEARGGGTMACYIPG
jgi:hypothetical protein